MELGVNSNPNIEMLDRMYNASLSQQKGNLSSIVDDNFDFMSHNTDKGAIIQRNINLAPFYRDYNKQKRELLSWINKTNTQSVQTQSQNLILQKIEYNKFSLQKWDIYRKLVNQLVDVLVTRKKK